MKFGDNFHQLSIPEWKSYNLDYNGLKYQIRNITQSNSSDLSQLHSAFIENFDYINLFIKTKFGELTRKFDHLQNQFNQLIKKHQQLQKQSQLQHTIDYEQLQQTLVIHLDDLFYQCIELSIDIKNLSKFIIIQKIAIKKIFKKFLKYYQNKQQANKFIITLKNYFLDNLNVNLNDLTLKLTNLINVIKYESKSRSVHLKRSNSLFSISSTVISNSDYSNSILPSNSSPGTPPNYSSTQQCLNNQPCPTTPEACFDLNLLLKKNFQLHCLANQDSINELMINFNLYFQLKNLNDNIMSCTYLTRDYLLDEPAYIVSHNDTDASIIVAPVGGLRKYAYCILSNHVIQALMDHLNDRDNEVYKNQLSEFFTTTHPNLLTKKTVDYIVSNDLKPTLKLFCKRARYTLEQEDEDDVESSHKASCYGPDDIDKDYLITLDSDIMTTDNLEFVNDLSFPKHEKDYLLFDVFPHAHLAIYSNDINLCNFEYDLVTEIDLSNGGIVKNQVGNIRKLPKKIQTILNNNSLTLFKGLNFYQYQLSCYHNIIPQGDLINNHYSNLLNLNLLKNFENIEKNNQQVSQEVEIIKQKSDNILRHKQSIQSLSISAAVPTNKKRSSFHQPQNSMGSSSLFDDNAIEEEPLTEEDEQIDQISLSLNGLINQDENLYIKNLKKHQRHSPAPASRHPDSIFPSLFDRLYDLKQRLFNEPLSHSPTPHHAAKRIYENPFFVDEDEVPLDPYTKLLSLYHTTQNYDSTYDSINEDPIPYLQRNDYKRTYEYNYDRTLSYVYFSLNLVSIFLSGIQLGIFISILQDMEYKFLVKDNVGIIVIIILGILTSLIFCLISINLLFQRFVEPPMFHWAVVLIGLFINLTCWSWSVFLLINCF